MQVRERSASFQSFTTVLSRCLPWITTAQVVAIPLFPPALIPFYSWHFPTLQKWEDYVGLTLEDGMSMISWRYWLAMFRNPEKWLNYAVLSSSSSHVSSPLGLSTWVGCDGLLPAKVLCSSRMLAHRCFPSFFAFTASLETLQIHDPLASSTASLTNRRCFLNPILSLTLSVLRNLSWALCLDWPVASKYQPNLWTNHVVSSFSVSSTVVIMHCLSTSQLLSARSPLMYAGWSRRRWSNCCRKASLQSFSPTRWTNMGEREASGFSLFILTLLVTMWWSDQQEAPLTTHTSEQNLRCSLLIIMESIMCDCFVPGCFQVIWCTGFFINQLRDSEVVGEQNSNSFSPASLHCPAPCFPRTSLHWSSPFSTRALKSPRMMRMSLARTWATALCNSSENLSLILWVALAKAQTQTCPETPLILWVFLGQHEGSLAWPSPT